MTRPIPATVLLWLPLLHRHAALSRVFHAYPGVPGGFCACVQAAAAVAANGGSSSSSECRLHSGRHHVGANRCHLTGARGTKQAPIVIADAGDGPVVVDGTVAIGTGSSFTKSEDGAPWFFAPSGGHALLQLFVDGELQVLARYPNARWSDKSVFYAVREWSRSKPPGEHNLSTGVGRLVDAGSCSNMSAACCARCNAHDLARSGTNGTGALGVLNIYSCDTGVQKITRHSAADPSVLHYHATWHGLCDTYRGGDGRYFLQGTRELLDAPEEWLLDPEAQQVLMAIPPPAHAEVRGRVSDFALMVENSSHVTFANLSFFATTLSAAGDVSNLTFSNLEFNYSGVSRRALMDERTPPIGLTVWRAREADAGGPPKPAGFVLSDITVRYSDGPALMVSGAHTKLSDCVFEWNDWTTVGGSWPQGVKTSGKAHRGTTVWVADTEGVYLRRLTFRNNGAAQSINAGGTTTVAPVVELCSFESQLAIQDDGAFVEGGGRPSTRYIRNWCTSTGKAGLRWDGMYSMNVTGGEMVENVVWNASALVVKGDAHNVTANTVFDGSDITASHAAHDRPRYQDDTSPLNDLSVASVALGAGTDEYEPKANQLTVFERNIFDFVGLGSMNDRCPTYPNCTLPGQYLGNVIGTDTPQSAGVAFDVRAELRDPYHYDFRACPGSIVAASRAGAYPAWSATATTYWIPGRREREIASTPVPPMGSIGIHLNTDLMFLPARLAMGHSVYFGLANGELAHLEDLSGSEANIVRPTTTTTALQPNTAYVWRVDTHIAGVGTVSGSRWRFRTGAGQFSCLIAPHPPPRPPKPGPALCAATAQQLCPGLQGTGGTVGSRCYECVVANSKTLKDAGCWAVPASSRHEFVESFCDAENAKCTAALCALCSNAKRASAGDCLVCADSHAPQVEAAGCTDASMNAFCLGAGQH